MEFIKKNIILFAIITTSLIASAIIAFLAIGKNSEMADALSKVSGLKKTAEELDKEKLHPVTENVTLMEADIKKLNMKIDNLVSVYGNPNKKLLELFVKTLDAKLDAKTFKAEFLKVYKEKEQIGSLKSFLSKYSNAKKGLELFKNALLKRSAEKNVYEGEFELDENNKKTVDSDAVHLVLLESLGIKRILPNTVCSTYLNKVKTNLRLLLENAEINMGSGVDEFAFAEYTDVNLPKKSESGMIAVHCGIIADLIFRIKESEIKSINSFEKTNGLEGAETDKFQTLKYKFSLNGKLSNIRKFVNSLQNAYKDNRIYIIKKLSFDKKIKNITGLKDVKAKATEQDTVFKNNMKKLLEGKTRTSYQVITAMPNFGAKVIGDDEVSVEINLEYIRYTGNDIK